MGTIAPERPRGATDRFFLAWIFFAVSLVGCVVNPAPGADKIKLTKASADVSTCSAVGNVQVPRDASGNPQYMNVDVEFRNLVIGLGGNVGFITAGSTSAPSEGIAYRCP